MSSSLGPMIRLRTAGAGVVIGGILLAILSLALSYSGAAGVVLAIALGGGIGSRKTEPWVTQCFLGIGAVGAIGAIESVTARGLGVGPFALGALAIVFGTVDVIAGSLLHRFRTRE